MAGSVPFCLFDTYEHYRVGQGTDLRRWLLASQLDHERVEVEFHVVREQVVEMMCSWTKDGQQVEEVVWSCWQQGLVRELYCSS